MYQAADMPLIIKCLRYYAGWRLGELFWFVLFSVVDFFLLCSDKITGQTFDLDPGTFAYTRKEAVGVCGQIIPW